MKIAIIGTRGIPNYYGGFEQFAEYLSRYLVKMGCHTTVYNSDNHPYKEKEWEGVHLIHCKDPEDKIGTVGQFIYDFNCIKDARGRNFDIILQLGYTSSSIWRKFLPKDAIIITNMDGLEWKRTKFSKPVQNFIKIAERLGVKSSDYLIADSIGIQDYLKKEYNVDSKYIPYGARVFEIPNAGLLEEFDLKQYNYNMLIARLEPENSIDLILEGVQKADKKLPFLVIGKYDTKYGEYLRNKFQNDQNIKFLGGIYDMNKLNNLRYFSNIYFHGHTVGGTNPSLLEAMASSCFICANDNVFNRTILEGDAVYFSNTNDIENIINNFEKKDFVQNVEHNLKKIRTIYSWDIINKSYLHFMKECFSAKKG